MINTNADVILKDRFICHLVYEHDFIQQYNDMIVESCDWQQHVFVVYANHAWDESKKYNMKNSYYIDDFSDGKLKDYVNDAAQIIVHCLYTPALTDYLYQNQHLLNKVNWKLWGGDLYLYRQVGGVSNSPENEVKRKAIIPKLGFITTSIKEEYEKAIEVYGGHAKHQHASYLQFLDFCDYPKVKSESTRNTTNILVGNSGHQTSYHLEAFASLEKYKGENIKIYSPLSYGDKDYIKEVCAVGEKIFGDKFVPVHDFMPFDEYIRFLATIDIALMNHNRQQGVGNIVALLYLGKKVYMQPDITTYKRFNRMGVRLYDINEIDDLSYEMFVEFQAETRKTNSDLVEANLNNKKIIEYWQLVFDNALNQKNASPKRFFLINFHYKDFYSDSIRNPSIGPAYIMQHLGDNGIITKFYELSFNGNLVDLINDITSFSPDLIGCSFMTHQYRKTYRYIDSISQLGIPIVCGGAHVNSRGAQVLSEVNSEYAIQGEGEDSLLNLINNLENPDAWDDIPGLIYRKNNIVTTNLPKILAIEDLHFPKYDNFQLDKYADGRILIQTSRGCPYRCTFCQQASLLGKKWRSRSSENIMREIEYWGAKGMTNLLFADDNLTLDKKRINELCGLMQKSKYRFQIETAGVRIDNVDYDTLARMKDVGFNYLSFGIESGSDRVLKEIRKGITLSQIHKTLEMSAKLDYEIKLYFIINNRTETYKEAHESFELARQYPINLVRFSNLTPLPNTYDYDWILEHGRLLYSPDEYLNNPNDYIYKPLYDGPGMRIEEREQLISEAQIEIKRIENGGSAGIEKCTPQKITIDTKSKDCKTKNQHSSYGERVLYINHNIFPLEISGTPISTYNHAVGMKGKGKDVAVLVPSPDVGSGYQKNIQDDFILYKLPKLDKYNAFFGDIEHEVLSEYLSIYESIIDDFAPDVVHINDYVFMPESIISVLDQKDIPVVRSVCNLEEICHMDYPVISNGNQSKLCSGPETAEKCAECHIVNRLGMRKQDIQPNELSALSAKIQHRFDAIRTMYEKHANGVIFTEASFEKYFHSFVKLNKDITTVIPRGIVFDFERKFKTKTIEPNLIRFAFIGHLMFSKGIDIVLEAFEIISKEQNIHLDIYGVVIDRVYGDWVKQLEAQYPSKIKYHGQFEKKDIQRIADSIDVAIVPSHFDTYNRVVREFLYMGVPIIATNFFGSSIIKDGINGLKINTGDSQGLADGMKRLANNPSIINELFEGVKQTVIPSLTDEVEGISNFYDELAEKKSNSLSVSKKNQISNISKTKLIAFYLPQYHPIPQNDEAWGKGFTEWTNVKKAKPLFSSHYQPQVPSELGYYDLRSDEVRAEQIDLAKQYGLHGFCYYYYWFNGEQALETPLTKLLANKDLDFPFCVCWANENWTRKWDGHDDDIIFKQNHNDKDDIDFIRSLFPYFSDDRYIRVDGKLMLLIYRTELFPDINQTAMKWREEVRNAGLGELYLVRVESFVAKIDPLRIGFDAAVEFAPDWSAMGDKVPGVIGDDENDINAYDYQSLMQNMLAREQENYTLFRGVTPSWDNTARRGREATLFVNSSPKLYEKWLTDVIEQTRINYEEEQFVFINAWNEWGEGSHLEPDTKHGRQYLEATKRAIETKPPVRKRFSKSKSRNAGKSKVSAEYENKLNQEIAIYEHNTEVHDLPEIHNVYAKDFLVPHLTDLTGRGDAISWWVKDIDEMVERTNRTIHILSLACGNGDTEIGLLKKLAEPEKVHLIGVDVNPNMIGRARSAVREEGIQNASFEIQDLNNPTLHGPIDVIIANHSLHHILELDKLFQHLADISSDDMMFLINDMVGRNGHVMWPNAHIVVQEIWRRLDQRYKLNGYSKNYDMSPFNRDCSMDGFEGIRAEDILPALIKHFDIDLFLPFSTLINRFVDRGYGNNFDAKDDHDRQLILDILSVDIKLLKEKKLSPTQAFIRAQRKGSVQNPQYLFQTPEEAIASRHYPLQLSDYYREIEAFLPGKSNPVAEKILQEEINIPLVSVVIPVFNNLEFTHKCIKSMLKNTRYPNYEVIIVDNASTDGTAQYLQSLNNVHIKVLSNKQNLGFVGGCNAGADRASGEFIFFLNNDTEVKPNWISAVVDLMHDRPDCGAVGSKLVYPDGDLQEAGGIIFSDGDGWNVGRTMDPSDPRFNYVREVDYCSGAALTIRADLWKTIGGFDQRYSPAYYEDTDLCFEVRRHGYKVFYNPLSEVIHHEGKTAGVDLNTGFKRFQKINRLKFQDKWQWELTFQHEHDLSNVVQAAERGNKTNILIADPFLPQWDRASGSLRLFQTVELLASANYHVVFIARMSSRADLIYYKKLISLGVEVYPQDRDALRFFSDKKNLDGFKSVNYEVLFKDKQFKYAILSFWDIAAYYTPIIRKLSPETEIIVDTVDVHFIRELREAQLKKSKKALQEAHARKMLEIITYQAADSLWVVTHDDRVELEKVKVHKPTYLLPNIHKPIEHRKSYDATADLLFVGNFSHTPNQDGILYFCESVFPIIKESLPDVNLYIVGNNPTLEIFKLGREDIIVTGFVEDISPYLYNARVSVNPLRYGAGMKGKVGEALSWGLPVVTSTIGAEGMSLEHGTHCLIADEPDTFAQAVIDIYNDQKLWESLSTEGRELVESKWSPLATQRVLNEVLECERSISTPLVSIVILTWNALKYTRECVESISKHTEYAYEIIFVDNASTDGTQEYLKELVASDPRFKLIQNTENKGFAAGNNQGVRAAQGKYVLLLNNDVLVAPGWLSAMVKALELDPHIGMVGPITNHISGRQMIKDIPYSDDSGFEPFAAAVLRQNQSRITPRRRIAGFAVLMRKAVYLQVGGLDESFGIGNFEDDDLCLKVRQEGYAIMVHEGVFLHHYGSQSFKANKVDYLGSLEEKGKAFKKKWPDVDYEELLEIKDPLSERHPRELQTALRLLEKGDPGSAQERYEAILLEDPLNEQALEGLIMTARGSGLNARAVELIPRLLKLNSDSAFAYNASGLLAGEAGNLEAALRLFGTAMKKDPDFLDAQRNYAEILLLQDAFSEGVQALLKILERHPDDIPTLLRLAELNLEAGRSEDALELTSQVLTLDPAHRPALELKASMEN